MILYDSFKIALRYNVKLPFSQFARDMIMESHKTISILFLLLTWVRLGAPHPKMVTSDGSVALFTDILTVAHSETDENIQRLDEKTNCEKEKD